MSTATPESPVVFQELDPREGEFYFQRLCRGFVASCTLWLDGGEEFLPTEIVGASAICGDRALRLRDDRLLDRYLNDVRADARTLLRLSIDFPDARIFCSVAPGRAHHARNLFELRSPLFRLQRRHGERYHVPDESRVELVIPDLAGSRVRAELLDIGSHGLAFALANDLVAPLEVGDLLVGVKVGFAVREIATSLEVRYIQPLVEPGTPPGGAGACAGGRAAGAQSARRRCRVGAQFLSLSREDERFIDMTLIEGARRIHFSP